MNQKLLNMVLRWFMSNDSLHHELTWKTVAEYTKRYATKHKRKLFWHDNIEILNESVNVPILEGRNLPILTCGLFNPT